MADQAVAFNEEGARRTIKAVRAIEAAGLQADPTRAKHAFSIVQIVVPRSATTPAGFYLCDVYNYIADSNSFSLVLQNQLVRALPDTL